MKEFLLNKNTSINFQAFNVVHLLILTITYVIFICILYNKNKINNISEKSKKIIRIIFGLILLITFVVRRGSYIYYGVYTYKIHLDLGFCNMINLLFIIYCFTGNKKLYNVCYYGAFCGPLLSVLFPSVNVDINNYSFLNFIMIHNVVFLMNIVFAIFNDKKYNKKDFLAAVIILIFYLVGTYGFNMVFDTRYNRLINFLTTSIVKYNVVRIICEIQILNITVLIGIGRIMFEVAKYILNLLNGGNYEKD